jgi:hypothetical protein
MTHHMTIAVSCCLHLQRARALRHAPTSHLGAALKHAFVGPQPQGAATHPVQVGGGANKVRCSQPPGRARLASKHVCGALAQLVPHDRPAQLAVLVLCGARAYAVSGARDRQRAVGARVRCCARQPPQPTLTRWLCSDRPLMDRTSTHSRCLDHADSWQADTNRRHCVHTQRSPLEQPGPRCAAQQAAARTSLRLVAARERARPCSASPTLTLPQGGPP